MKKRFRTLEIVAKNWINTFFSGPHLSSYKDSLIDVDTVRDYQPGDKKLDSKSSIKSGRVMSRVFNPERAMTISIILDFSSSQITKFESALTAALYFAFLANNLFDRVGLLAFSDRILSFSEPSDDALSVISNLEKLYKNEIQFGEKTNFELALSKVRSLNQKNTLFVLISDFCFDLGGNELKIIRQMAMEENNSFISLVLFNEEEWLTKNFDFDLDFFDIETNEFLRWKSDGNKSILDDWKSNLRLKLRQSLAEPLFLDVNDERFLMPVIRYLSRG